MLHLPLQESQNIDIIRVKHWHNDSNKQLSASFNILPHDEKALKFCIFKKQKWAKQALLCKPSSLYQSTKTVSLFKGQKVFKNKK